MKTKLLSIFIILLLICLFVILPTKFGFSKAVSIINKNFEIDHHEIIIRTSNTFYKVRDDGKDLKKVGKDIKTSFNSFIYGNDNKLFIKTQESFSDLYKEFDKNTKNKFFSELMESFDKKDNKTDFITIYDPLISKYFRNLKSNIIMASNDGLILKNITENLDGVITKDILSPDSKFIFFIFTPNNNKNLKYIYSVNTDTLELKNLTEGFKGFIFDYNLSKNGDKIIFRFKLNEQDQVSTLWLMNYDGKKKIELNEVSGKEIQYPRFSPDSKFILYILNDIKSLTKSLCIINLNDLNKTIISDDPYEQIWINQSSTQFFKR
jgi:hypothetical protein